MKGLFPLFLLVFPMMAAAQMAEGIEVFGAGNFEVAQPYFEAVLAENDGNAEAHYYLGRIALTAEDGDAAVDHLERAVKLEPNRAEYHAWLSQGYLLKLQTASSFKQLLLARKTRRTLLRAIELDPTHVEAHLFLGNYYLAAPAIGGGSKKKARAEAETLIGLDPATGYAFLAQIHRDKDDDNAAEAALHQALAHNVEATEAWYELGVVQQRQAKYAASSASFQQAIALEPEHRTAFYQLGKNGAFSGEQLDDALEPFGVFLRLQDHVNPEETRLRSGAYWRMGMIHEHRQDTTAAIAAYQQSFAIAPRAEVKAALDRLVP
ncbi:MAG: hypothetical protein RhofKO_09900 [Rhodothermales bacterium]